MKNILRFNTLYSEESNESIRLENEGAYLAWLSNKLIFLKPGPARFLIFQAHAH